MMNLRRVPEDEVDIRDYLGSWAVGKMNLGFVYYHVTRDVAPELDEMGPWTTSDVSQMDLGLINQAEQARLVGARR